MKDIFNSFFFFKVFFPTTRCLPTLINYIDLLIHE